MIVTLWIFRVMSCNFGKWLPGCTELSTIVYSCLTIQIYKYRLVWSPFLAIRTKTTDTLVVLGIAICSRVEPGPSFLNILLWDLSTDGELTMKLSIALWRWGGLHFGLTKAWNQIASSYLANRRGALTLTHTPRRDTSTAAVTFVRFVALSMRW